MRIPKVLLACSLGFVVSATLAGCSTVHSPKPQGEILRSDDPAVVEQLAYAKKHYAKPNRAEFGDLGGTDCVNFTSQTLLARGWKMTTEWAQSNSGDPYTRAWISSTALRDYLTQHAELATPLTWKQRGLVAVGDIVQFDWDNSGDRDHTAIISGIEVIDGKRRLLVAQHSPGAWDWPISTQIAEHGDSTRVYFWHLKH